MLWMGMGWLFESEKERMPSLKIHRIREIRFGHAEKNAYMVVNTLLAMSRGLSLAVLRAFTWSLCNLGWKGAGDRAAISPFHLWAGNERARGKKLHPGNSHFLPHPDMSKKNQCYLPLKRNIP